jgi:two-component system chemotaxis response regulator CheY
MGTLVDVQFMSRDPQRGSRVSAARIEGIRKTPNSVLLLRLASSHPMDNWMASDNALLREVAAALTRPLSADSIWVADDSADVRLLLSRAFKRFLPPVGVEFFSDGSAIVERIRRGAVTPKLLLLDFEMPSLNGIETIKTLVAEGHTQATTIIVFSVSTEPDVVCRAYESGAHFFVQKPIDGDEYLDVAKLCLKCLDLPAPTSPFASASTALHVASAPAIIESRQPAHSA